MHRPARIRRVSLNAISEQATVAVQNTSNASYFSDREGQRWVGKRVVETGYEALLGEALGWLLAYELKAPVPDACVAGTQNNLIWLSSCIENVVHWNSTLANQVQNMRDLGSLLALDCILFNEDRHVGNILLEPHRGNTYKAWGIDFDHSLVGWPDDFSRKMGKTPSVSNLARGLPVDNSEMREGAVATARLLEGLDHTILSDFVAEAGAIIDSNTEPLLDALESRSRQAVELTNEYLCTIEVLS